MLRSRIDSFLGTTLLAAIVPIVLFSAIRSRIGFAPPRRKRPRPAPPLPSSPSEMPLASEFQFDRAIEAYEHLIDSVIAQERV